MGLLSEYFPQVAQHSLAPTGLLQSRYTTFTESAPTFATWDGCLYDHPLTRAAIERFAVACSKLKPEFVGAQSCKPNVRKLFDTWPNDLMTWPTFLARAATIYEMDTTIFIVPALDRNLNTVALFPVKPSYTEICEYEGEPWCIFHMLTGDVMAIEYRRCAVVTKFQFLSDFFGSGNDLMHPTLRLLDAQNQAEQQAVLNGARIRFIGKITGMTHGDDLNKKREKFYVDNLSAQNYTGLMLYDNTFEDIKQIDESRFIIDEAEMERVSDVIYSYLGINKNILQNDYDEEHYGAWYEGKVEPFAVQVSEAITKSQFTVQERRRGNFVMFSSSKLEYATNSSKRNMVRDMIDRGIMTINEGREILQLPPVEGGDVLIARGEYKSMTGAQSIIGTQGKLPAGSVGETDFDLGGDDQEYSDTDGHGSLEAE